MAIGQCCRQVYIGVQNQTNRTKPAYEFKGRNTLVCFIICNSSYFNHNLKEETKMLMKLRTSPRIPVKEIYFVLCCVCVEFRGGSEEGSSPVAGVLPAWQHPAPAEAVKLLGLATGSGGKLVGKCREDGLAGSKARSEGRGNTVARKL